MERSDSERLRRMAQQLDQGNTSLCLENLIIMQENEQLRRKALQLDQENKALLAKLKQQQGGPAASSARGGHSAAASGTATGTSLKATGKQKQPE